MPERTRASPMASAGSAGSRSVRNSIWVSHNASSCAMPPLPPRAHQQRAGGQGEAPGPKLAPRGTPGGSPVYQATASLTNTQDLLFFFFTNIHFLNFFPLYSSCAGESWDQHPQGCFSCSAPVLESVTKSISHPPLAPARGYILSEIWVQPVLLCPCNPSLRLSLNAVTFSPPGI